MINFDHSSITNPQYTPQGITFLSLKSSNLKGRGEVSIYLPSAAKGKKDVPCIILLHGVYGSHFSWLFQAGVHLVLEKMIEQNKIDPFILVMPSDGLTGDGSGYLPHPDKNHEKWIVDDVIEAIRYHFSEITLKSPIFISGLSMGGFGALHLGIRYHQIFSGISAHSSITDLADFQTFIDEDHRDFLSPKIMQESPIIYLAKKHRKQLPPLRLDCGDEDRLIESNRRLHRELIEVKIDHVYEEFPGIHNYEYWTKHIADSFTFFQSLLSQ